MTTTKVTKAEAKARIDFTLKAIDVCKKANVEDGHPERLGMNVVATGYNAEFEKRFGEPSRQTLDAMQAEGVINGHPVRGGYMVYLNADKPATVNTKVKNALASI